MPNKYKRVRNAILSYYNIQSHESSALLTKVSNDFYQSAKYADGSEFTTDNYIYVAYNRCKYYLSSVLGKSTSSSNHCPKSDLVEINEYNALVQKIYDLYSKTQVQNLPIDSVCIGRVLEDSITELDTLFNSGETGKEFQERVDQLSLTINTMLLHNKSRLKNICTVIQNASSSDAMLSSEVYSSLSPLLPYTAAKLDSSIPGIELYAKRLFSMLNTKVLASPELPTKTIRYFGYLSTIPSLSTEFREHCQIITMKSSENNLTNIVEILAALVPVTSLQDQDDLFLFALCDVWFKINSATRNLFKSNISQRRLNLLFEQLNIAEKYITEILQASTPSDPFDVSKIKTLIIDLEQTFSNCRITRVEHPKLLSMLDSLKILLHYPVDIKNLLINDICQQLETHLFMLGFHEFLNKQAGPKELELVAATISLTHIAMKIHLDDPQENIGKIISTMQYFKDCNSTSPVAIDKLIRCCESYIIRNIFCNNDLKNEVNDESVKLSSKTQAKLYFT